MRGYTLIELMVAVAILGIASALSTTLMLDNRALAARLLQRERALQILEAQADPLSRGAKPDEAAMQRLLAELPGARLTQTREGPWTRLRVSWSGEKGKPASAELAVVAR
jgi:prepilin-type N-terminal cleavage/methylation domain-containing protein